MQLLQFIGKHLRMILRLTKSGGFLVSLLSVFMYLSLKCKTSAISLVETASMFLIFLITSMQISMECETKESEAKFEFILT